jgi:large subunit ribosomal protein L18
MNRAKTVRKARMRRHVRVRKRVRGTPERPRLTVFRSLKNIYAQIVDDSEGKTLCSASSLLKEVSSKSLSGQKIDLGREVGRSIAEKAQKEGIKKVVFDKGGYRYHGRVKALAEAARKAGLEF